MWKYGFSKKDKELQVRTVLINVESFWVFDFLLLAKYSSKEYSQTVASKECWPGDLLPEIL